MATETKNIEVMPTEIEWLGEKQPGQVVRPCRMPKHDEHIVFVGHEPSGLLLPTLQFLTVQTAIDCARELHAAGVNAEDPHELTRQLERVGEGYQMSFAGFLDSLAKEGRITQDHLNRDVAGKGARLWRADVTGYALVAAKDEDEAAKLLRARPPVDVSYSLRAWPREVFGAQIDPQEPVHSHLGPLPWSMWDDVIEANERDQGLREVVLLGLPSLPVASTPISSIVRILKVIVRGGDTPSSRWVISSGDGWTWCRVGSLVVRMLGDDPTKPPQNPQDVATQLEAVRLAALRGECEEKQRRCR